MVVRYFFFQAEDGIRDVAVTGVQTCALPISLSIGSLAIDPTNSSIIYVGTGEQNFSGDSYYGAGVLKSIDGGATWTQQGANVFVGPGGGSLSSNQLGGGAHVGADPLVSSCHQIGRSGVFRCRP